MSNFTGLSANNPLRYLGPTVAICTCVSRNRAPTSADYRQPETGKLYPFDTYWLVGKDPTTGVQGDLWYLSKIVANVAYWLMLSTGSSGPMLSITVPLGESPIVPDGSGVVNFISTDGSVEITGSSASPNNHTINFEVSGGIVAVWERINSSQTLVKSHGYMVFGNAVSLALPAVSVIGDTIEITLDGGTSWTVTQPNAASQIRYGNVETTLGVGGSIASNQPGDYIRLVCQTANGRWNAFTYSVLTVT